MTTTQIGATTHVASLIITSATTAITTTVGDTLIRTITSGLRGLIVSATGSILTAIT